MESNLERDCGAYGSLFLSVISELRGSSLVWEDFTSKATKLHTSLKSTLIAVASFLEAFQKVADMATSSRGATKEIGSALTRLCLRHKAIETKLKRFTGTIQENIVSPIQESMEDWKKMVVQLDKDHAKEYKKSRLEIKKCAADTAKLQKKVKKGKPDMQGRLDSAIQDVNDKYILLEEQEKTALRNVLIEERGRFCLFISCLKPFVDEEIGLLTEVTHLQEIMDHLCLQADNPKALPASSEQIIKDLKGKDTDSWKFQKRFSSQKRLNVPKILRGLKTPPSSPSSLGSRKSSMCSISSIASSSSGSVQSHSPCHNKNIQQQQALLLGSGVRLTSVSSQDSGFTSQDTLFLRPTTPSSLNLQTQLSDNASPGTDTPEMETTPSTPSENYPSTLSANSTLKNWPNPANANKTEAGRPHTISSAYEKSHARPALSSHTFEPPQESLKSTNENKHDATVIKRDRPHSTAVPYNRPSAVINKMQPVLPPLGPKPKSRAVAPPKVPPPGEPPIYANLNELSPGDEVDADRTPTDREPPNSAGLQPKFPDGLDLTEAIRDLDTYTAALHGDFTPGDRRSKRQKNSMELAAAIKQLDASTAALENSYDTDKQASQASLQCSSGYGTMSSTPAGSEDTIASGDFIDTDQKYPNIPEHEKYFTIPRNSQMFRAAFQSKRPASTAGIPMSAQGGGIIARRSSMNHPKPPPPVRRSSSITSAANPALIQKYRTSPPKQLPQQTQIHSNAQQPQHRRSSSTSGTPSGAEPAYAELQEIQQSIQARHQQQQQQQMQGHYGEGYAWGQAGHSQAVPPTQSPQYAEPVTLVNSNTVNSLDSKLSAMNLTQTQHVTNTSSSISQPVPSTGFVRPTASMGGSGGDFPDLPPPPTDDELRELEKIYSVPKGKVANISQSHSHPVQTQNSVQMRSQQPAQPHPEPVGGVGMRQSLISEMKSGNKFRKLSQSDQGSESQC